jgi:hypothetical protein
VQLALIKSALSRSTAFGWTTRPHEADPLRRFGRDTSATYTEVATALMNKLTLVTLGRISCDSKDTPLQLRGAAR